MLFSYAVRSIYIESCSLFVRGGVYRVVKEAMGGFLAKLVGLRLDVRLHPHRPDQRRVGRPVHHGPAGGRGRHVNPGLALGPPRPTDAIRSWGSVVIACAVTLYFFRQNVLGIHESSGKALKIMMATTSWPW